MKYTVKATQEYTGLCYFTTTIEAENPEAAIVKFKEYYANDPRKDDLELHISLPNWGGKMLTINLFEALDPSKAINHLHKVLSSAALPTNSLP